MERTTKPRTILHDPFQGELWATDDPGVTNTISLWDVAPRSIPGRARDELKDGNYLKTMERTFTLAGQVYQVTLKPARIKDRSGKQTEQYPGERERLVEWVIRRIAAMRNRISLSSKDEVNVSFSIHEVRTELARTGHTYSFYEIVDALQILHQSIVEIVKVDTDAKGHTRERVLSASTFPQLAFADREKESAKSTVQLNWLATEAMKHLNFRQMNYDTIMNMRGPVERWIYTKLNHDVLYYRMHPNVHVIHASEVIDGTALSRNKPRDSMKRVTDAMGYLREQGIILEFQTDDLMEGRRKADVRYTIAVTEKFINETTHSLQVANENLADYREIVGRDPTEFIASDPMKKDKLRRNRTLRVAEREKTALLL